MSEDNLKLEELKDSLKSALHKVAVPLEEIDFTKENYNKLFPRSRVKTPIENVKLGANQFEKLEKNERQKILQAVHDTLATPDMIINEEKEDVFGEKENSHLYAKSYIIDDKIHGIQSVVVSIDGENVSISTHERDINNIVNKIKKPDQLLYAAAEVRLLVEQHTELPQSVVNPNRDSEYVVSPIQNISQNQTLSTSTAKRKIYLSGKITGDEGFAEKFKAKEEELAERGDYVFNPALHPNMFTHEQFMQIDLLALSFCDSIYLMDNWRGSKGAKMEFEQAKVLGLDVEFEKEPYILLGAVGYYSDKSDEFDISDAADISADDMFGTKEEAEKARNRLLHKEAGNVQILPASEVFGKKKDLSHLISQIKTSGEISYVRPEVSRAASMILSNGKQQPPSLEQSEEINKNDYTKSEIKNLKGGSKITLNLGNLYNTIKKEHIFEPTTLIESGKPYDYLLISEKTGNKIRHSIDDGIDHYDLILFVDAEEAGVACRNGETCEVIRGGNGFYILKQEDRDITFTFGLSEKELEIAAQKIDLTKSLDDKEERYAPESFIRDVQEAIAPNPYMSDAGIIQTAKDILFERDIALGLEDSRRLSGLNPTDYTAKERDEINEALIALGGTQNIVDILKNTDPTDVKPLMDGRKQFETLLDKEGIKHSTNKDGTYKLDYGSVIFNTTNIIWHHPKYPAEQTIGPYAYIDMKNPKRTAELVQMTVRDISKYRNQQIEKKSMKSRQNREVGR